MAKCLATKKFRLKIDSAIGLTLKGVPEKAENMTDGTKKGAKKNSTKTNFCYNQRKKSHCKNSTVNFRL